MFFWYHQNLNWRFVPGFKRGVFYSRLPFTSFFVRTSSGDVPSKLVYIWPSTKSVNSLLLLLPSLLKYLKITLLCPRKNGYQVPIIDYRWLFFQVVWGNTLAIFLKTDRFRWLNEMIHDGCLGITTAKNKLTGKGYLVSKMAEPWNAEASLFFIALTLTVQQTMVGESCLDFM